MANPKDRYQRHRTIHEKILSSQGKGVAMKTLVKICNVSERTIYEDLEYMELEYKAPLKNNRKKGGYYYTEAFVLPAIENLPLTQSDLDQLTIAVETLNQFEGLKLFEELKSVFQKISNAIRFKIVKPQTTYSNNAKRKETEPLIYFENVPFFKGSELIPDFYKAIERQMEMTFLYKKFGSNTPKKYTLRPYWLKEHKNRWYVIGETVHDARFKVFGLDRIYDDPVPGKFFTRQRITLDKIMRHSFGMYISQKVPSEIELRFSPKRAEYFKAQPFFAFDKNRDVLVDNEKEFCIQTKLIINDELVMELVKLGPDVEVVKPIDLRNRVVKYLQETLQHYQ